MQCASLLTWLASRRQGFSSQLLESCVVLRVGLLVKDVCTPELHDYTAGQGSLHLVYCLVPPAARLYSVVYIQRSELPQLQFNFLDSCQYLIHHLAVAAS